MDILKVIKKDHDEALSLIKKMEPKAEKETAELRRMAKTLATEVILHAKSEEQALYEACEKYNKNLKEFSNEGYIEHQLIAATLKKLVKIKADADGEFKAYLAVIKELIEHHGREEEEKTMFPKFRRAFDDEQRAIMGDFMEEYKEQLRPKIESLLKKPSYKPAQLKLNRHKFAADRVGIDSSEMVH